MRQYNEEPVRKQVSLSPQQFKQANIPFLSDPVRRFPASTLGSADRKPDRCDPSKQECYPPYNNSSATCTQPDPTVPVINYLIFDESTQNPSFKVSPDPNEKYTRLNLNDASVIMNLQNFLKDEVMPRFAYNDYTRVPKGPLAILRPSLDIPDVLGAVRDKVNVLVNQNNAQADAILERLVGNRIQQLIQDTVLFLVANKKITIPANADNLKTVIDKVITRLSLSEIRQLAIPEWSLARGTLPANLTDTGDPNSLLTHLNALRANSELIDKQPETLGDVLTLAAKEEPFLDFFNFSARPYNLLKLDILLGVYVDADGELSLRPTPGVFLESLPKGKCSYFYAM
jgi:hypothetical protein